MWSRVASLVMRETAAMIRDANGRLQCYRDDPALIVGGQKQQRQRVRLRTKLLWMASGLRSAWAIGQLGNTGEGVGAHFRPWNPTSDTRGLIMRTTKKRVRARAESRNQATRGPRGLVNWLDAAAWRLHRMLWAAVYSMATTFLPRRPVETLLAWFAAWAEGECGPMETRCSRRSPHRILITLDAS